MALPSSGTTARRTATATGKEAAGNDGDDDNRVWFRLLLCDVKAEMVAAWRQHFQQPSVYIPVEFFDIPFQEVSEPFDCIVSPANSFGLMDGGIDLYISHYFGGVEKLVPKVQKVLLDEFCGQQPVGTSIIIDPELSEGCRFIAHTPTMRLPVNIAQTDTVYRAMWSMLLAVRKHNRCNLPADCIRTVLCPGLGTGCGGVSVQEAASQMALAYKHFVTNPIDTNTDPSSTSPGSAGYLISWNYALGINDEVKSVIE